MLQRKRKSISFYYRGRTPVRTLTAVLIALALVVTGCGSGSKLVEGKTNVVTSFYPLYFLAKEIGGDETNVVNLIPAGVEPHDWTPKSRDLDTASKAQLFLYNGAGLEGWVDNFLKGLSGDRKPITVKASEGIAIIDGNAEEGDDAPSSDTPAKQSATSDPHTWVSPKSMLIMAQNVRDSLIQADSVHSGDYEANYAKLADRLKALDAEYAQKLSAVPHKDIVVSHRAFGYLARDYGLHQVAIMGLSPDAEPKAQDLLSISKFVKEKGIRYIFFEELVSDEVAKALAREAGVDTMVLNPLEGLTPEQDKRGDDYFSLMELNLQNLLKALQ